MGVNSTTARPCPESNAKNVEFLMADRPIRDLSEYPRPWFYRPEIYYGFFIFPPVWSILTLRSPWHNRTEGFRGILIGGIAWFIIIASVVLSVRWVQEGGVVNLFIFVPGLLLTLVTQIQWSAHRARYGPPPTEDDAEPAPAARRTAAPVEAGDGDESAGREGSGDADPPDTPPAPRRRRRRRRRPISRSADSPPLC